MRERDRELKRRRHRRLKRLKKRPAEEAVRTVERPSGSKRAVKKPPAPAADASSPSNAAVAEPPAEAPKKKAPAKKAPAKKAPAPAPVNEGGHEPEGGPEEPQGA
jgi:hypothetical protein